VFGQSVTFTAKVTSATPGTITGTVTFKSGGTQIGSPQALSGGKVTFSTSALTVGAHSITATYNGSTNYNTNVSPALTQTVNKAATSTTLTSSQNSSMLGMPVAFTVTVATLAPGSGTPTGSITLKDGSTSLQTMSLSSSGKATFVTSFVAPGSHPMTAVYLGSANNLGSTSAVLTQAVH
jgi:hypothetical protein